MLLAYKTAMFNTPFRQPPRPKMPVGKKKEKGRRRGRKGKKKNIGDGKREKKRSEERRREGKVERRREGEEEKKSWETEEALSSLSSRTAWST